MCKSKKVEKQMEQETSRNSVLVLMSSIEERKPKEMTKVVFALEIARWNVGQLKLSAQVNVVVMVV